jgi:hypothetical protein
MTTLTVPCFHTTLMGVLRGVGDHLGLPHSDATLYRGSGHAFLINIHRQLCPSGPYCWKMERYVELAAGLGIEIADRGFFSNASSAHERAAVEAVLRERLDAGAPCSLLNMENQLITGYDASGFDLAQPWERSEFPPARLSFGSWAEFGDEIHVSFFTYGRTEPQSSRQIAEAALRCALDMLVRPQEFSDGDYAAGLRAYDNWIAAVEAGHGASHGNWWNATVWAECRARAADYLAEAGRVLPELTDPATELVAAYGTIAGYLERLADREMDRSDKLDLLRETQRLEEANVERLRWALEILADGG